MVGSLKENENRKFLSREKFLARPPFTRYLSTSPAMFRTILFWAHFSLGTILGIFIAWLAATGFLLSFETQLTDGADRSTVTQNAPVNPAQPASQEKILQAFQQQFPDLTPSSLILKNHPNAPITIQVERDSYQFHPTTAAYLGRGDTNTRGFFHTVTTLHRWFALKGDAKNIGQTLLGISALTFSFLLVTGLILWIPKKFTAKAFRAVSVPNLKLKGRARNWNLHLVCGLWFAPLIAIISLSGSIIAFPWMKQAYVGLWGETAPAKPNRERGGKPEKSREKSPLDASQLDATLTIATAHSPNWQSLNVEFPKKPNAPLKITANNGGRGQNYLATEYEISRPSLTVESEKNSFAALPKARQLLTLARWAHTGELAGIFGQILAALTALTAILLTYTGFALGLKRLQNLLTRRRQNNEPTT